MSGHSKFANIKNRKERNDSKRGKIFTKIGREIVVAVKSGGSEPATNTRLREIIAKAKAENMPNDTIQRSIKKASGELGNVIYESIIYEGYGPSGVAVVIECLTDNKNRTAANIRHALSKYGGNLGTTGCVSFIFEKKGQIIIEKDDDVIEDTLMILAIEAGAEDFISEDEGYEIITETDHFAAVYDVLVKEKYPMLSAEITMIPTTTTDLETKEDIDKLQKMLDQLEEDDDVQNVYTNWGNEE
ncbi:MAG: YebC/PmpR family DNA-binding transcriptional regulator [Firmicutes bacterium HGW-Firmicutes-1]|jgi:YebC/PmpR family DNA-binding regulatory protein|nr:MAG: YebC/PmpR family DNA-binding transcriptional regulator [Firmicutes bacterium HGW-Firmicutes-1]